MRSLRKTMLIIALINSIWAPERTEQQITESIRQDVAARRVLREATNREQAQFDQKLHEVREKLEYDDPAKAAAEKQK